MIKLLMVLFCFQAVAAPKDIEVWFLSNSKVSELHNLLNRPQFLMHSATAELACQEMGDYCFDPQYGLYKKDDVTEEIVDTAKVDSNGPNIPVAKSIDRNLIDCDPNNHFDMFCGKAKPVGSATVAKLDVWIDTSSSMREFDFSDKDGSCHRKSLVKDLDAACGFNQKVNIMMFDTSIKQAGSIDSVCNNQGLNDYKRLMDWIERSDAKKLIVITDKYEFQKEFADYIESKNGKFRGDKDPLTAAQMANLSSELAKSCK